MSRFSPSSTDTRLGGYLHFVCRGSTCAEPTSGSVVKSYYEDGLLWTLLQENSVKDRLLEKGSEEWLSIVDAAKPKLQT